MVKVVWSGEGGSLGTTVSRVLATSTLVARNTDTDEVFKYKQNGLVDKVYKPKIFTVLILRDKL